MRVACVRAGAEADAFGALDVLVLPEAIERDEIFEAAARFPSTLVVGACADGPYMRGYAIRAGENRIEYLKTLRDGRSDPFTQAQSLPVVQDPDIAIGVLICRDYENADLRMPMLEFLRASSAPHALICIPADMHGDFFQGGPGMVFSGVPVALCNHSKTYKNDWRCRSFIAASNGTVLVRQVDYEAISADLPSLCTSVSTGY